MVRWVGDKLEVLLAVLWCVSNKVAVPYMSFGSFAILLHIFSQNANILEKRYDILERM